MSSTVCCTQKVEVDCIQDLMFHAVHFPCVVHRRWKWTVSRTWCSMLYVFRVLYTESGSGLSRTWCSMLYMFRVLYTESGSGLYPGPDVLCCTCFVCCTQKVEVDCIQDLMFHAVHVPCVVHRKWKWTVSRTWCSMLYMFRVLYTESGSGLYPGPDVLCCTCSVCCTQKVEVDCIQDLMFHAVHVPCVVHRKWKWTVSRTWCSMLYMFRVLYTEGGSGLYPGPDVPCCSRWQRFLAIALIVTQKGTNAGAGL